MDRRLYDLSVLERTLSKALGAHRPATKGDVDLELPGGLALQLKRLASTRDLHAALLGLAYAAGEKTDGRRVALVAQLPRMGARRAQAEWKRFVQLMPVSMRRRLGFVALASDRDETLPPDNGELSAIRDALGEERPLALSEPAEPDAIGPWSAKQFDVWRVLLAAWLRCERPLQIREIQKRTGTHYSTVASTIARLELAGEIERASNRSVRLSKLPHASLAELVTVGEPFRRTRRYVDGSGRAPDPVVLLKRLQALAPEGIAIGGVTAARHYVPGFDLNGLPRVDVTCVGGGLEWIPATNAALQRAAPTTPPLLVVHRLDRPEPLFEQGPRGRLPFADPAEVLLDLYELRLNEQAEDFVRTLRRKQAPRD